MSLFPDSDSARNTLTASPSGTVRPRNRRLLSTEQELVSTSGTSTPSGSRAVSPIPSKHPSRSATSTARNNGRPVGGLVVPAAGRSVIGSTSPVGFGGIWEGGWTSSWSAIQGLASSVLGVEVESSEGHGTARRGGTKGRRKQSTNRVRLPDAWGPEGLPTKPDSGIGMGSTAERDAAVRAKKMVGVLEGRGTLTSALDTNGNYKRRTSMEEARTDGQHEDEEGDALVYVHHVQSQDTLAGVVLRYNCQPAVFRKANRFWPNDSIQIRKVVVLPIDACAIKGRPCDAPEGSAGVDLLAPTPGLEDPPPITNGQTWPPKSSTRNETPAERPEVEDEHPWVHVRWVLLDSSPSSKPVEIARMPRKTLGYFPPRRRKSQATSSTVSTPRGSTEIPRISLTASQSPSGSRSSTPQRRTSNLGPRPSQPTSGSYFPASTSIARPRRESVGETADRLGWMKGPGGVGTLGKSVRMPGPAQDSLNKWAKKHIPGLAIDNLPSTSVLGAETAQFGFNEELSSIAEAPFSGGRSGTTTPSGSGQGRGLENAAAAIEGWVRKLAIKGPVTPKLGARRAENADLIELLDGAGSDDGRGFELTPPQPVPAGSSSRGEIEGLMRGRASAAAKGGKGD